MADTLENKIENAKNRNAFSDDLGQQFRNKPSGEFLLLSADKNLKYAIIIYEINILPEKAIFSAGMAFRDPASNKRIAFAAKNVAFSYAGGITGPVKMELLDSISIKMGKFLHIQIPGNENTYAIFDCSGLQEIAIQGNAVFQTEMIEAVDDTGAVLPIPEVVAAISGKAKNWDQMITEIRIPPFRFHKLPDYIFSVEQAWVDISETYNPDNMRMPDAYKNYFPNSTETLWEGIFIRDAEMRMPHWMKHAEKEKLAFGVHHIMMDEFGFTGDIYSKNVIPFDKGNLGSWNFSLTEIRIQILLNHLHQATFKGELGTPAMPDTSRLIYAASADRNGAYLFTVQTAGTFTIPALKAAEVRLNRNSYIAVSIQKGNVKIDADFNGSMCISEKNKNAESGKFQLPEIEFTGMHLRNYGDKFDIAYLGISRKPDSFNFNRFPLQLEKLAYTKQKEKGYLQTQFALRITEYASASASMQIACKLESENGKDKLKFYQFTVSSVSVAFEKSGIYLQGEIQLFREDPVYGNGFGGTIHFGLNKPDIEGNARAIFGKVNEFRYWYFDAGLQWGSPGLPVLPGMLAKGFSGGAWHRLKTWDGKTKLEHPEYGLTGSGAVYIPDPNSGLGLKAGIVVGGANEKSYQANLVFEIQFNASTSISKILFYGDVEIMPENTSENEPSKIVKNIPVSGNLWDNYCKSYNPQAQLCGPFMMVFDFSNHCYAANAAIFVKNAAGNTLNGIYKNNKAGEFQAFFGKNKWYLRLGTPKVPLALHMTTGNNTQILAKAYFMAGHDILPPGPPPAAITQALGNAAQLDGMRNLEAFSSGKGFAYGATLEMFAKAGGGDKKISVYASLHAIAAMDVNLMYYGNIYCSGRDKPLGMHGWYSNGNIYTFLQGKIGAGVGNVKVDIMTLTGAMALQLAAPNPFYARGSAMMELQISSFLKFRGNIQFELGEPCEIQQNVMPDSSLIISISPGNSENKVSTVSEIKLEFAVAMNSAFQLADGHSYQFWTSQLSLQCKDKTVPGLWRWNAEKTICIFTPTASLLPLSEYRIWCDIELTDMHKNGEVVRNAQGNTMGEYRQYIFYTGGAEKSIPTSNILASLPMREQWNYYLNDQKNTFIQLKIAQNELVDIFGNKPIVRITALDGSQTLEFPVTHKSGLFQFQCMNLNSNTKYLLRLLRVSSNYVLNSGSTQNTSGTASSGSMGLDKKPNSPTAVLLLEYHFRTSCYASLADKMKDMQVLTATQKTNGIVEYTLSSSKGEYWSPEELQTENPSLRIQNYLISNTWYQQEIASKMYSIFQTFRSSDIIARDISQYGFPPVQTMELTQENIQKMNTRTMFADKNKKAEFGCNSFTIRCNLHPVLQSDFLDIQNYLLRMNGRVGPEKQMIINRYVSSMQANSSAQTGNTAMQGNSSTSSKTLGNSYKTLNVNSISGSISNSTIAALKMPIPPKSLDRQVAILLGNPFQNNLKMVAFKTIQKP
ncbi:MAG: hypothetical protein KG003_11600 [Bacteroidetes bacterium]|nr:hypothetical protein [Bacteroidota bacterium]